MNCSTVIFIVIITTIILIVMYSAASHISLSFYLLDCDQKETIIQNLVFPELKLKFKILLPQNVE